MRPYEALYPVGSLVRIADLPVLQDFLRTWEFHNRLQPEQLAYAGSAAKVVAVGFYHGGDPLYTLEGVPGVWHESCLEETA
jgi:hypothetical protein